MSLDIATEDVRRGTTRQLALRAQDAYLAGIEQRAMEKFADQIALADKNLATAHATHAQLEHDVAVLSRAVRIAAKDVLAMTSDENDGARVEDVAMRYIAQAASETPS